MPSSYLPTASQIEPGFVTEWPLDKVQSGAFASYVKISRRRIILERSRLLLTKLDYVQRTLNCQLESAA